MLPWLRKKLRKKGKAEPQVGSSKQLQPCLKPSYTDVLSARCTEGALIFKWRASPISGSAVLMMFRRLSLASQVSLYSIEVGRSWSCGDGEVAGPHSLRSLSPRLLCVARPRCDDGIGSGSNSASV